MSRIRVSETVSPVRMYPADLTPQIKDALRALADIETRYEVERRELEHWSGPRALKQRLLADVENRHTRERQPLVQRLAELQQKMTWAMVAGRHGTQH